MGREARTVIVVGGESPVTAEVVINWSLQLGGGVQGVVNAATPAALLVGKMDIALLVKCLLRRV